MEENNLKISLALYIRLEFSTHLSSTFYCLANLLSFDNLSFVFSTRSDTNPPAQLQKQTTLKFLNFRTPENFAVIYLKFKKIGQTFG